MRKITRIFIFFIAFMIILLTSVNAEESVCKVTLSADKKILNPGDEVTITLNMTDITKTDGIYQYVSVLQLSNDIFEIITLENSELQEALNDPQYQGCKVLYNGDDEEENENPWGLLYIELLGEKAIMGMSLSDPQIEDHYVGKIKLKVKDNVKTTNTKISIIETTVFDMQSATNEDEDGDTIEDSEIELQIKGDSQVGQIYAPEDGDIDEEIDLDDDEEIDLDDDEEIDLDDDDKDDDKRDNKEQKENKSKEDVPYAGIEDYIPFIFIGIIISVITYINYRKYKNI